MVDSIHEFLIRKTASIHSSGAPSRERLGRIIGAVDHRVPVTALQLEATTVSPAEIASTDRYTIQAIRWPVFEDVAAAGLLIQPRGTPRGRIVALPDADWSPEMSAGLVGGLPPGSQLARRFAESGWQVLVPVLIDTRPTFASKVSDREWLYRMSFETGRSLIGYEVQEVLAAVDWFDHENVTQRLPIAVAGQGEGGMLALFAAALDPRIEKLAVTGYEYHPKQLWQEPIYRDVWGLLPEFDEPGMDELLAPRKVFHDLNEIAPAPQGQPPHDHRPTFDPSLRLHKQFDQLVSHTQALLRRSPQNRTEFWKRADASSPQQWKKTTQPMREYIWNEMIGRMPDPNVAINARTKLIYDEPKFLGYEVMMDVWPGIFNYGILLVPKDLKPGERRAVVVCQHGLEGRPNEVADPNSDSHYYHRFAARLANEGFITYSPQNPYIGKDHFRQIQREAHPLKLSLFSFIIGQHQRLLEWLGQLPFVDATRIGFYGLSYGGKTAVRVPPLLDGYALSICSADFNEWVWKTTSIDAPYSYLPTQEYDMYEFNFANIVNYSDLANLMAPRPFMVERGHDDGVAPDEWVAYEYAKVRRFYDRMGIGDRTAIEFFQGPHTIHGEGTFAFLRRFLK
jgi:dienelactone hydrolase